jgi:hypothetical protein
MTAVSDDKQNDNSSKDIEELRSKLSQLENREKITETEEEIDQFYARINASIENGMFDINIKKDFKKSIIERIKNFFIHKRSVSPNGLKEISEKDENMDLKKTDNTQNTLEEIFAHIKNARDRLPENKLNESEMEISKAKRLYIKQLNQTPSRWKFSNIYAGYAWIYLVAILVGIFTIFYSGMDLEKTLRVHDPAINATTWGVIGAVLRAMWFLKSKVDTRTYMNSYNIYFISVPFLGGILGAVIYLILLGGIFALQGNTPPMDVTNSTNTVAPNNRLSINPLTIIPFAALAGYNWEWAVKLFNKIGDFLMEDNNKSTKEQKRKEL